MLTQAVWRAHAGTRLQCACASECSARRPPVPAALRCCLKGRWPFALRRPTVANLGSLLPTADRPQRTAAILSTAQCIKYEGAGLAAPPAAAEANAEAPAAAAHLSATQHKAVE